MTITYYRSEKLPLSKFTMIVTPLRMKTSMIRKYTFFFKPCCIVLGIYTACDFDCFSDMFCIDRSLVCDRYKNCPNSVDEAYCSYSK